MAGKERRSASPLVDRALDYLSCHCERSVAHAYHSVESVCGRCGGTFELRRDEDGQGCYVHLECNTKDGAWCSGYVGEVEALSCLPGSWRWNPVYPYAGSDSTGTADPPGSCDILVGAVAVPWTLGVGYHLFIVTMDHRTGDALAYRGEGGGSCFDPSTEKVVNPRLATSSRAWSPDNKDADESARDQPFVTVMSGVVACAYLPCIEEQFSRINNECREYVWNTGPNSNTVVRSVLAHCGLPEEKPLLVFAPGWDHEVI